MTTALRLTLRPMAETDLTAIWDFTVARWSADQARIYLAGLGDTFALLCANPGIARKRTEFSPPIHLHPFRSNLVIYRVEAMDLEVIRVVHARSDWAALWDDLGQP